ncbi:uncharacterized protein [Ptychodera flava]|uniref:uncharacterized protein n=1 Tax=Ptychodera flava TaxID=63121 RepID=UPI00396A0C1F
MSGPEEGATAQADSEQYPVKARYECNEINKRSVAKFMVKYCGNEGVEDEEDNRLRKLLQGAITHLEKTEEKNEIWNNAEITIYDKYADCYILKAGQGEFKYLVHLDGRDEVEVICTEKPSWIKKKVSGFFSMFNPSNWFSSGSSSQSKEPETTKEQKAKTKEEEKDQAMEEGKDVPKL